MGKYLVGKINLSEIRTFPYDLKSTGATAVFAGRVRADRLGRKTVKMIEYSSYDGMAERVMQKIDKQIVKKYKLTKLVMKHRTGRTKAGEVAIVVAAEAGHRKAAIRGMEEAVERIKKEVPIWKKEIFEDGSYRWI